MQFPDVKPEGGKGLFISMKDGDKIMGVFTGDPSIFKIHWIEKKSYPCTGKEICPHCATGDKAKFRFKLNFITQEAGVYMAKIFEGSYGTFLDLKQVHESDFNLDDTVVSVTRRGQKADTRYIIMPLKTQPAPKEFALMKKVPLNDLGGTSAPHQPSQSEEDMPDFNESVPF